MRRFLIIITFLLALVIIVMTEPAQEEPLPKHTATLYVWGIHDMADEVSQAKQRFQQEYPETAIEYKRFSNAEEYDAVLAHELARQKGPDILLFSEDNKEALQEQLVPVPGKNTNGFSSIVKDELSEEGMVYGLPVSTSSLVIYYNAVYFGENYPKTWDELGERSKDLKVGGVAMGELSTLRSGWDLVKALMLQKGLNSSSQNQEKLQELLTFYKRFADPKDAYFNWSENLNKDYELDEIESFVRGKVASIAGDAATYDLILGKIDQFEGIVPRIVTRDTLRIAPLPQLNPDEPKALASYQAYGVSKNSSHPDQAWALVKLLTDAESARSMAEKGMVPGRIIAAEEGDSALIKTLIEQVPYSRSFTLDQGLASIIQQNLR